jgi:hypothetical protein
VPEHTLIPKRKGFATAIEGLGDRLDAVYDATIFYADGIPSLSQYGRGLCHHVKLHIRRYPVSTLPKGEEALADWLRVRYHEKDEMLARWEAERRS